MLLSGWSSRKHAEKNDTFSRTRAPIVLEQNEVDPAPDLALRELSDATRE
jgi:hypothetical protein